jgi:hypothetical protein
MIKSRGMRWGGQVANMGEMINSCRFVAEKPEGKRKLGRTRSRLGNNIKKILEKKDSAVWTGLIWFMIETNGRLL